MDVRATIGRTGISRFFVGVVLVTIALGLGLIGGYLAANLSGTSTGGSQSVHAAPGTVLRQDAGNPIVLAPAPGTVLRQDQPKEAEQPAR
jgi:hypothetical protein